MPESRDLRIKTRRRRPEENRPIGRYGRLHREYLKEEHEAMYRETPEMIALRRNEGCITVEREAAFFAVFKCYDIPLA